MQIPAAGSFRLGFEVSGKRSPRPGSRLLSLPSAEVIGRASQSTFHRGAAFRGPVLRRRQGPAPLPSNDPKRHCDGLNSFPPWATGSRASRRPPRAGPALLLVTGSRASRRPPRAGPALLLARSLRAAAPHCSLLLGQKQHVPVDFMKGNFPHLAAWLQKLESTK